MLGMRMRVFIFACTTMHVHGLIHACVHLLVGKTIEVWIPNIATNFHVVYFVVHMFCAPELCNLAHNPSPLFDLFDGISLMESNKHIQWS